MSQPLKYAVFGSGSWATAIVKMLSENLENIGWYMRSVYAVEHIKRNKHNPNYLSSAELHPVQLDLSYDINETVKKYDYLILAIPSAFLKSELEKLTESEYFDGDELHERLLVIVENLSEKQRRVFQMKYFDDLSFREISGILDISESTLKSSYYAAVKTIEEKILIETN